MIREATLDDAQYFVDAGKAFCEQAKQSFDLQSFADSAFHILTGDDYRVFVYGDPVTAHCGIALTDSMYDKSVRVARVFTTWGDGGIKCFRHAMQWAEDNGIHLFMADSLLDRRIEKLYGRLGMFKADVLFTARLNDGC